MENLVEITRRRSFLKIIDDNESKEELSILDEIKAAKEEANEILAHEMNDGFLI